MTQLPILVVEDEFFIALDIERVLTCAGYNVVALAATRSEALAFVDNAKLAFVDLNLSDGLTGPSIACDLAERGIMIVYLTANPEQIDPVASTALGCICKPFDDRALVAAASIAANGDFNVPGATAISRLVSNAGGPSALRLPA